MDNDPKHTVDDSLRKPGKAFMKETQNLVVSMGSRLQVYIWGYATLSEFFWAPDNGAESLHFDHILIVLFQIQCSCV